MKKYLLYTLILKVENPKPDSIPFFMVRDLMIEIDDDKIPLIIGVNLKPCPVCGKALSFAYDHYFCRNCPYDEKEIEYHRYHETSGKEKE